MAASSNDIINVYSKKTESAGNGLFASKDIPAGDLILRVNRPLVTVSDSPHLNDTCSNCCIWVPQGQAAAVGNGKEKVTLKACTGCKIVRYCGKVGGVEIPCVYPHLRYRMPVPFSQAHQRT